MSDYANDANARQIAGRSGSSAPLRAARHVLCVLALMWTGIVNGQPFFFADTTNYIRAADMAVYLGSGRTLSTVWTDRYRTALPDGAGRPGRPAGAAVHRASANDLGTGLVMSGRSPYIGALMYLGWVGGWFWPFVAFQAVVAYLLILLTLERFGLRAPRNELLCVLALALATSLPTYNSLLLADGFASFGLLAVALVAADGRLGRWQLAFLVAVALVSVAAHLTHLMMLLGITAVLALMAVTRRAAIPRRTWYVAGGVLLGGVLAVQATSLATRLAIGREPQLLPLLTARFYMDGPGRDFIRAGCPGHDFAVCHVAIDRPFNNAGWLFSLDPVEGVYMLAPPEVRRRMGEEDVAFAWAVLRHDPLGQIGQSLANTARQAVWFDYTGLNQGCFERPGCWDNLPPPVRTRMMATPSGRNAWPEGVMNAVLYAAVIASLIALFLAVPRMARVDRPGFERIAVMLVVIAAGMLVCSVFGGAVADPQYRYQGRLIWLLPLMALVAVLRLRAVAVAERRR